MVDTVNGSIFPGASQAATANQTNAVADTTTGNAREQLIQNFDTFLELLVAQIQNQDPTSPVETETFTQQLVQFSDLEQSIQSNDNLETILSSIQSQNAANVVSYIGSTVTAQGSTTALTNGQATFNVQAADAVTQAQVLIRDNLGNVVFEGTQDLNRGNNELTFDGDSVEGRQFNEGDAFSISVTAQDADENPVNIATGVSGVVDGVDFSGTVPNLRIGQVTVPLTAVTSVNQTI